MEISNSLKTVLKRLRLSPILHTLPERLAYARKTQLDYADLLELVLQDEIDRREQQGLQLRLDKAAFTEAGTFEGVRLERAGTFDRDRVRDLFSLGFLDRHEDVLFMGPVVVGKTHLAEALRHAGAAPTSRCCAGAPTRCSPSSSRRAPITPPARPSGATSPRSC